MVRAIQYCENTDTQLILNKKTISSEYTVTLVTKFSNSELFTSKDKENKEEFTLISEVQVL